MQMAANHQCCWREYIVNRNYSNSFKWPTLAQTARSFAGVLRSSATNLLTLKTKWNETKHRQNKAYANADICRSLLTAVRSDFTGWVNDPSSSIRQLVGISDIVSKKLHHLIRWKYQTGVWAQSDSAQVSSQCFRAMGNRPQLMHTVCRMNFAACA